MKIIPRDPSELRLHPLQKLLPDPVDMPDWVSFVEGIRLAGWENFPAIVVTPDSQIMEGNRRWRAAKQLGWKQIKTEVQPGERASSLIVDSMLNQRSYEKGIKLYLLMPILEEYADDARDRAIANLKRGVKNGEKPNVFPKAHHGPSGIPFEGIMAFCERLGVSRSHLKRVRDVHRKLHSLHPADREIIEHQLYSGAKTLTDIARGFAAVTAPKHNLNAAKAAAQMELFGNLASAEFEQWPEPIQKEFLARAAKAAVKIPDEIWTAMEKAREEA